MLRLHCVRDRKSEYEQRSPTHIKQLQLCSPGGADTLELFLSVRKLPTCSIGQQMYIHRPAATGFCSGHVSTTHAAMLGLRAAQALTFWPPGLW